MDIKIAIAYHREAPLIEGNVYLPLHVGAAMHPNLNLGLQRDDTGLNISAENYTYCELTGLYWLWKNVEAEAKGLIHYRRAFAPSASAAATIRRGFHRLMGHGSTGIIKASPEEFLRRAAEFAARSERLMADCDIIAARPAVLRTSVDREFRTIGPEYITLLLKAVDNLYPDYAPTLRSTLSGRRLHFGNMTVMRSTIFDEYCTFLFATLAEVKRLLIADGYLLDLTAEKMFARKLGYLGELLTHAFVVHARSRGRRIKELPVWMSKS